MMGGSAKQHRPKAPSSSGLVAGEQLEREAEFSGTNSPWSSFLAALKPTRGAAEQQSAAAGSIGRRAAELDRAGEKGSSGGGPSFASAEEQGGEGGIAEGSEAAKQLRATKEYESFLGAYAGAEAGLGAAAAGAVGTADVASTLPPQYGEPDQYGSLHRQ